MIAEINPEKALIFRITHRDNVPWILNHGLHSRKSTVLDPNFATIGNTDIITKRDYRTVPHAPGGTLSDYVPFYFTPRSIMLMNIITGHNGIKQHSRDEIVIIVSSLPKLRDEMRPFLFTDRHALTAGARFTNDLANLDWIDWNILRNSDFRRDNEDIGKSSRYMAEALVHESLPVSCLLGLACATSEDKMHLESLVNEHALELPVIAKRGWYF